mgnify:CR=1 FL=1
MSNLNLFHIIINSNLELIQKIFGIIRIPSIKITNNFSIFVALNCSSTGTNFIIVTSNTMRQIYFLNEIYKTRAIYRIVIVSNKYYNLFINTEYITFINYKRSSRISKPVIDYVLREEKLKGKTPDA